MIRRARPALPPTAAARPARRLEDVLGGCELCCGRGACWRVETPLDAAAPVANAAAGNVDALVEVLRATLPLPLSARHSVEVQPERAVLLDIETGGFAGTPVFLIGIVLLGPGRPVVVQLLARDYPEEEFVLRGLVQLTAGRDTWITFNGRAFDEPFLRDRAILHRVRLPAPRLHVDLLPAARRAWKHSLPDCRLGTLEREVLGRTRIGDIPGADVPDLFHYFMRTGHAAPLRPVLEHNRADLVSCLALLGRLAVGSLPGALSATIRTAPRTQLGRPRRHRMRG